MQILCMSTAQVFFLFQELFYSYSEVGTDHNLNKTGKNK